MSNPPARTLRDLIESGKDWLGKKGMENPRLDTEVLIAHALGETRLGLYMDMDRPVTDEERAKCRELLVRRSTHEPVAYITGEREFYGLTMNVSPSVLIPRPDTEILVEFALKHIDRVQPDLVVDVCTGSGCVAIAIAHERPELSVIAVDISEAALEVAAQNVMKHGLKDRVELRHSNLLKEVASAPFVVGNPPYVSPDAELMSDVVDHEPSLALFGEGHDALEHHRRILDEAIERGAQTVLLEIGYDQAESVAAIQKTDFDGPEVKTDLGGHPRVAVWTKTR